MAASAAAARSTFSARLTHGRYTSLRRSDLAATIYGVLDGAVETIFGDSVARIEESGSCVRVSFDHAPPREADLVIGADGLHSRVRQLVFGPDAGVEVSLGYHVAAFEVEGYRPRDELVYLGHGVPGRQIFRFSMREDKTLFLFAFRDEYLTTGSPASEQNAKRRWLTSLPTSAGNVRAILAAMAGVSDIYFDQRQPDSPGSLDKRPHGADRRCRGLCLPPGRRSAGLAMAEAYVLAGELATAGAITARPSLAIRSG